MSRGQTKRQWRFVPASKPCPSPWPSLPRGEGATIHQARKGSPGLPATLGEGESLARPRPASQRASRPPACPQGKGAARNIKPCPSPWPSLPRGEGAPFIKRGRACPACQRCRERASRLPDPRPASQRAGRPPACPQGKGAAARTSSHAPRPGPLSRREREHHSSSEGGVARPASDAGRGRGARQPAM